MKTAWKKRVLALLLACVMVLGLVPAMAAEEPVTVTFSIDTRAIADDPAILEKTPILDGTKTVEVPKGASVLDATRQAAEKFGFSLDASSSGFITSIGWADASYAFEIMGSAFGGWTFWVDGASPATTAANVPLEQDSTIVWRYSVTGPDFSCPTYDEYFDLMLLDEETNLKVLAAQAQEIDTANYTAEELETIDVLVKQAHAQISAIDDGIAQYEGMAYCYFIDHMGDEAMGYPLKEIISDLKDTYRKLNTAVMQLIPVTEIKLEESFVRDVCVGQTYQLKPTVLPENATNRAVTYTVDDSSIAVVDENGLLTALKDAIAIVTATSVDNPEAVARCTFMFQPAPKPESISIAQDGAAMMVGEQFSLTVAAVPSYADVSDAAWSVTAGEEFVDIANGVLTAKAPGEAAIQVTAGGKTAEAKITVLSSQQLVQGAISGAANWILSQRQDFAGKYETAMDWDMFALARGGHLPGQTAQANYLSSLAAFINEGGLAYPSDIARTVLVLGAMGVDPADFAGHNLIAELTAAPLEKQGINAYVYALLALDSGKATYSREKIVAEIAKLQQPDGYFWIQEAWGIDNDLTAMVVCAIAPYAQQEPAKSVAEKATVWLSSQLSENAGYVSWGNENSQTPAQVMAALTALGRNPLEDAAFIKGNKTLFSNVSGFIQPDGGIAYSLAEPVSSNAMATQQVLYCLSALERYQQDKAPLYDFSDVDTACDSDWLAALHDRIAAAQAVKAEAYTKTSYTALEAAITTAQAVTAEGGKKACVNAYMALQAALDGLQETIPVSDGKVTVGADTVGAVEPMSAETELEINVQRGAQQAYLELGQVADAMPKMTISFDDMTMSADKGTTLQSGSTAVQLPRELDTQEEAVAEELNHLLSGSTVREILRRTVVGGETPTVFDKYLTFRFADLGTCSAAYTQNGKTALIPTVTSDSAGKQYDIYAYRDGTDLVIKSQQTAEFLVFSVKKETGGGSGSGAPVVHVKVDASAVKGMKVKSKDVSYVSGNTAFDVLEKMLGKSAIKTDRAGDYVQGIAIDGKWLSEFDYGPESGWMYSVNGKFIQSPSTSVTVEEGDDVVWVYKTEMDDAFEEDNKNNGGSSSRPNRGSGSTSTGNQTMQVTDPEDQPEAATFADIADASGWARDAVLQAAERGLMQGYDGRFDPQRSLTRAEWTAVLTRVLGLTAGDVTVTFSDVPPGAWYVQSLTAAVEAGIVTGRSADCFAPDDSISREELCVMLSRALRTEEKASLTFADTAEISSWAVDSVAQMVQAGILQGRGDTFDPRGAVTREMAAVVCLRVLEYQK